MSADVSLIHLPCHIHISTARLEMIHHTLPSHPHVVLSATSAWHPGEAKMKSVQEAEI